MNKIKVSEYMQGGAFKWIIAGISLTGVILNIFLNRWGFACWIVGNAFWSWFNYNHREYALAVLFFVYFVLAVYGFWVWK